MNTERIEKAIPEGLIIKKNKDSAERMITVFDLIAFYAGLKHLKKDIYVDEKGEEFIRNQYGFQEAVRYNQQFQILEAKKQISKLEEEIQLANKNLEHTKLAMQAKEDKFKEEKEKAEYLLKYLKTENDSLRAILKELKIELLEYKQVANSVFNRLEKLVKKPMPYEDKISLLESEYPFL